MEPTLLVVWFERYFPWNLLVEILLAVFIVRWLWFQDDLFTYRKPNHKLYQIIHWKKFKQRRDEDFKFALDLCDLECLIMRLYRLHIDCDVQVRISLGIREELCIITVFDENWNPLNVESIEILKSTISDPSPWFFDELAAISKTVYG